MDNQLSQAMKRVPGVDPARLSAVPLEGGITNRNFRLEQDQQILVLRLGGENSRLLGIDRNVEQAASCLADSAGVGAEVVLVDPGADLLITKFIQGTSLTPRAARDPATLKALARVLREVHRLPSVAGHFSPFQVVRNYFAGARESGVNFPSNISEAFSRMAILEKALSEKTLCCCHNDLLAANFIHDGRRWRLIDWEYAAMGDPFFDLGNFAVNHELDKLSCQILLQEYFGEATPGALARLQLMRLVSDLRESLWGFLQSGISRIDYDFRAYGERHLERFLAHSKGERFTRCIGDIEEGEAA